MLPEFLKSDSQLYKRDTNAITTWLANTANSNGYRVHTNDKETAGRLKGKARKEARAVASGEKKQSHLLRLRYFVPLATFIAAVKPQIQVPLFIAVTIHRVIELRRTVSRFMRFNANNADEESNASHLHFVAVLEQVRDILKPHMPTDLLDVSSLQIGSTDAGINPDTTSRNLFDILNLYETTEHAPESAGATSPSELIVEYEPEPEDKYDEACLAFMSLLKDVLHQREKVCELWHNYRIGNVSLGPTAIGTNEAIDICRRMEEDVAPIIKQQTSMVKFVEVAFLILCHLDGFDVDAVRCGKGPRFDTYDNSVCTMWNASRILHHFVCENRQDSLMVYDGSRGWYDETVDSDSSTNQQKYCREDRALTEILSDIKVFGIVSDKRTVEDEFTRCVHTLLDNKEEVALWQCFAAQVYLDILRELEGNLDLAWSEMAGTAAVIKSSLTSALEEPGDVRLVENWREMEESLKDLKLAASEWDTDPVDRYKADQGLPTEPNQFLRRHPLYCGVWVHEMRARFHEAGVSFASAFGYVHQTYQLYHALQQERLLGPFGYWVDMLTLSSMQVTHDTFFSSSRTPTTAQGYLENLQLKSKLAITGRAQGKGKGKGKNKKISPPNSERGQLKELAPVSMHFKKRSRKTARRETTAEYLQKLIEPRGLRFVGKEDDTWGLEKFTVGPHSGRPPTPDIPTHQLIVCVTTAIRVEAHQLGFNLFLLHMDCFRILEEIRKTIDEQTALQLAPESVDQKHLPSVVAMVFKDAAGDKPKGLLQRAASVISRHLREPSSMASTFGERDLGFQPCTCPHNTGRGGGATRNCMDLRCGKGL